MYLVPPHAISPSLLDAFKDEFKLADVTMHGCNRLTKYDSAEEWLQDRPWLRTPGNFVFFSMLENNMSPIGCIRLSTNITVPMMEFHGFNIGYCIRPTMWKRGYGTQQLNLGLNYLRSFGLDAAMVGASDSNIASQRTILACGGYKVYADKGHYIYKIDLMKE